MTCGADADACSYRTAARRHDVLEGLARGRLLSGLLRGSRADPALHVLDQRGAGEAALVRRSLRLENRVRDRLAESRELLLELGLEVDVARHRVFEALGEGLHDRPADRLEPVLEVERAQHGLDERREHVAVARQAARAPRSPAPRDPSDSRLPSSSRRPTSAQLLRLTTYAQAFVSRPSEKSGKRS